MKTSRTALTVVALAALLSSCSAPAATGDPAGSPAASPGVATTEAAPVAPSGPGVTEAGSEEAVVEQTFRGYYEALLARDYPTACAVNAPETTATLIEKLAGQGVTVGTCEEALSTVYAIPGAAETADRIASGTEIQAVAVNGDGATVSWSAEAEGQRRTVDSRFRRIDGQWRLLADGI